MTKSSVLEELPIMGFGAGIALTGASLLVMGISFLPRNLRVGLMTSSVGATATHIGYQIAAGGIERIRGFQ